MSSGTSYCLLCFEAISSHEDKNAVVELISKGEWTPLALEIQEVLGIKLGFQNFLPSQACKACISAYNIIVSIVHRHRRLQFLTENYKEFWTMNMDCLSEIVRGEKSSQDRHHESSLKAATSSLSEENKVWDWIDNSCIEYEHKSEDASDKTQVPETSNDSGSNSDKQAAGQSDKDRKFRAILPKIELGKTVIDSVHLERDFVLEAMDGKKVMIPVTLDTNCLKCDKNIKARFLQDLQKHSCQDRLCKERRTQCEKKLKSKKYLDEKCPHVDQKNSPSQISRNQKRKNPPLILPKCTSTTESVMATDQTRLTFITPTRDHQYFQKPEIVSTTAMHADQNPAVILPDLRDIIMGNHNEAINDHNGSENLSVHPQHQHHHHPNQGHGGGGTTMEQLIVLSSDLSPMLPISSLSGSQNEMKSKKRLIAIAQPPVKSKCKTKRTYPQKCKCPYQDCDKSFNSQFFLTEHERTHTGEKPLKCRYCERGFYRITDKKKHELLRACNRQPKASKKKVEPTSKIKSDSGS